MGEQTEQILGELQSWVMMLGGFYHYKRPFPRTDMINPSFKNIEQCSFKVSITNNCTHVWFVVVLQRVIHFTKASSLNDMCCFFLFCLISLRVMLSKVVYDLLSNFSHRATTV